ncbi:MAG: tyrosine--tRNA ligase, partial [Chloroflexota bacterium]|nr:tyrosine--tRNA ligase [Chloroflexota bacterium]
MLFRVSPDIFARFPDVFIAVVAADGVPNGAPVAAVEAELRMAEREARERLTETGVDLQAHPFIARWRDAFRTAGINPNKYRSSVEALLTRVQKGSDLPALSPAVDLANAVSLRSWLPAGAHDVDRLADTLEVRLSSAGETFHPIGGAIPEAVEAGEIVYADAREVRTRRWIWRQGDAAKVTAASRRIFFPIDGWLGLNEEETREAAHELAHLLRQHLGVRAEVAFVHKDNPEVRVLENRVAAGETGAVRDSAAVDEAVASPFTTCADVDKGDVLPSAPRDDRRYDGDEIDELLGRGVVDVIVRADLERRLRTGEKLRVKLGIDPTAPRLHIGRAVPLRKLRRFQELGHTICLIIGDFTAQLGDASDKDATRRMLSEQEVYQNMASYKEQIGRILDASKVEWSYNSDWLGQLRFKDVTDLAQLFTVARMLERENFRLRYEAGKPIGLQEFMYPLMQGYDSYAIEADVEVGGTDQLFNLMAGRDVQRHFGKRPQDILTFGMIWGLDGRKMSTSEGNTILIDEPPVDMYGKIMSMGDDQIIPYFEVATEVPWREIGELARELAAGLNPMSAKKRLAYEITKLYHGETGAAEGQQYFERLHQDKGTLGDNQWPIVLIPGARPRQVGTLFVEAGIAISNSEVRRLIQQGGLELDGERVTD